MATIFFENTIRVLIHSVLSSQINPNWWAVYASPALVQKVNDRKANYARAPHVVSPGGHAIYYLLLYEVNAILSKYRSDFLPIIPNIDDWIVRLEQISFSRNVVAHMNWPNQDDLELIDEIYNESLQGLEDLRTSGAPVLIP